MARYKKSLTLNEALDLLMETDSEYEIFIEPPDVCDLTDEDSGDENLDGSYSVNKLSCGQLLAPAEIRLHNEEIDCDSLDDFQHHHSSFSLKRRKKATSKKTKTAGEYIWTREASLITCRIFPEGNYTAYTDFSPAKLFELFIDESILQHMKNEMTKYALKRNWPDVNVQTSELKVFISILLLSGYNPLPRRPMYWSKSADVFNEAVSNAMRRDRFDSIMKCLHFSAVNLDTSDKCTKLRPLIQHLQKKFMLHFVPTKNVSHGEAMVEYFGKRGCKQTVRNKCIRFGYKVWCQNTPQGYLCAFDIYQGRTFKGNEEIGKVFGKYSSTVLHLLENYSDEKKVLPYHFFFNNLFTSLPLLHELRKRGYDGTGKLRAGRLELCPLKSSVDISELERGCFDAVTGTLDHTKINITRWMDNAVVTVASTLLRENPVGKVKRWSRKDSKHIQVNIPHVIDIFNKCVGGTDLMNQNINAYRISIRGNKWWWPLFTWLIDVCVQNAWILARCTGKSHDLLEFRREIAMSYLLRFQDAPKTPGRKPSSKPGENEARFDQCGHFIQPTVNDARRRCAGETCGSRVRTQCSKCGVGLCLHCFLTYHTR